MKHLEELEGIRTELEERVGTGDLALQHWLVEHLARIGANIETDILDFSQEFENKKLKKLLSLLKIFKVTNEKLASFDMDKLRKFKSENFNMERVKILQIQRLIREKVVVFLSILHFF